MKISPPRVLQPPPEKSGILPGVCAAAPATRLAARTTVQTPNNTEANLHMVGSMRAARCAAVLGNIITHPRSAAQCWPGGAAFEPGNTGMGTGRQPKALTL